MGWFDWDEQEENPEAKAVREATEADIRELLLEQEQEADGMDDEREGVQAILNAIFNEEDVDRVRRALKKERELEKAYNHTGTKDTTNNSAETKQGIGGDEGEEVDRVKLALQKQKELQSKASNGEDDDNMDDIAGEDLPSAPRRGSLVLSVKAATKYKIRASDSKSVADQMKTEAMIRSCLADKDYNALQQFDSAEVTFVREKMQQELAIVKAIEEEEKHAPPRPPPPPIVIPEKKPEEEKIEEPFNLFAFLAPPPIEAKSDDSPTTIEALKAEIDGLKQQLVDSSDNKGSLMPTDDQYLVANKVAELESAIGDKEQELHQANQTIAGLQAQLDTATTNNGDTQDLESTIAKAESKWKASNRQVAALQADLEEANERQSEAQETIDTLSTAVETLEREKKQDEKDDTSALVEQLQSENETLRLEKEALAKDLAQAHEEQATEGETTDIVRHLQEEKMTVETTLQQTQQELEVVAKQVESLQAKEDEAEQALKDLRDTVDRLQEEKAAMQAQLDTTGTQEGRAIKALEEEKTTLEEEVSKLESQLAAAPSKESLDALQATVSTLEEEKAALTQDREENHNKDNIIASLEEETKSLQEKLSELEATIAAAPSKEKLEELEQTMVQLKQEIDTATDELEQAKNAKPDENELRALEEEKEAMSNKLSETESQLSAVTETKHSLEQELAEARTLEETVSSLQEKLASVESEKNSAVGENESLQQQLATKEADAKQAIEARETLQASYDQAEAKARAVEEEKTELEQKVQQLQDDLSTTKLELDKAAAIATDDATATESNPAEE